MLTYLIFKKELKNSKCRIGVHLLKILACKKRFFWKKILIRSLLFVFENKMKNGIVDRNNDEQDKSRGYIFIDAKRNKDIEQYDVERVVDQMAETESGGFSDRSTGSESEVGCHKEITDKGCDVSGCICHTQPNAFLHAGLLQEQVHTIMNNGGNATDHTEPQELYAAVVCGKKFMNQLFHCP